MNVGDKIYYAQILNGKKSVLSLKVRSVYKDIIVGINTKEMAISAPIDRCFYTKKEAQQYEVH